MPKVEITGTVDVDQFWPKGDSDADTVVVKVKEILVDGRPSTQFDDAYVLDHGEPRKLLRDRCVRVRLEGLDAPELHYPTMEPEPRAHGNAAWRQPRGGQCAEALGNALGDTGVLRCRATTEVELAGDVFDVYGRFIGEVKVDTPGPGTVVVNEWLLENGFAFPAIYTSAGRKQAKRFVELARQARRFGRGVWRGYTDELYFDKKLIHRHREPIEERFPVVFPKLFRRLAVFSVLTGGTRGFKSYLAGKRPGDRVVSLEGFLAQGTAGNETENLATFISDDSARPRFTVDPFALAFVERAGTTYDAQGRAMDDFE